MSQTLLPVDEVADLLDKKDKAELQRILGTSFIAEGATALVAGTVLLVLNQPHEVAPEERPMAVGGAVTGDAVWVYLRRSF